ncbi:hypothetical protein M23134_04475 [Microscilla marina ATCC 23134]|uniref:Uncharacterized protein n=1 Tax=Microscilla marina ATCC 23134 TaxID=313606 RepID=A1ZM96_MICM2|nr:hypothetical protein M23134_04475 [Microscilla marina ATCC 23134]
MIKLVYIIFLFSFTHYRCQAQPKQATLLPLDSLRKMKSMSFEEVLKNPTQSFGECSKGKWQTCCYCEFKVWRL